VIAAALSLFFCGCSNNSDEIDTKKEPHWHTNLDDALAECRQSGKPLLVLSIAGDLKKQC
jgi:hypothetical protein